MPFTRRGFGFGLQLDRGANFSVFGITIHHHPENDPEPCGFRFGIVVSILGMNIATGIFEK